MKRQNTGKDNRGMGTRRTIRSAQAAVEKGGDSLSDAVRVKRYLSKVREDMETIRQIQYALENVGLEDNSVRAIDYARDPVQTSPHNAMEEAGWKLLEQIESMQNRMAKLQLEALTITEQIQSVEQPKYRRILFERYVEGKSFEEISVDICFAYNYTCTLHGKALRNFEDKFLTNLKTEAYIAS